MQVETLVLTPYQSNCYVVSTQNTVIIIDPGEASPALESAIGQRQLDAVVCTHAHPDHVQGVGPLLANWPAPFYLHPAGEVFLRQLAPDVSSFTPLNDNQRLEIGDLAFEVIHVPGHAPDQVMLLEPAERLLFVGDLVFAGSVGRVDLPGSNPAQMEASLRKLCSLEGDYVIYTGHGPATTLEHERTTNPFLVQLGG